MKLDPRVIAGLTVGRRVEGYLRVLPLKYAATPLGFGNGQTRFASPSRAFRILYLGKTLQTAIAETLIRDRFVGKAKRTLTDDDIEAWGVAGSDRPRGWSFSTSEQPGRCSWVHRQTLCGERPRRPDGGSAKQSMRRTPTSTAYSILRVSQAATVSPSMTALSASSPLARFTMSWRRWRPAVLR